MTDTQRASPARIVLAHSGHLDTAAAIPWLAAQQRAEVIAVTIDLGQRKEWLEAVRDRALAGGALRAHVVDARDEFARDYLARGLKAGLLGPEFGASTAALATPLVARTLVSIAGIEQAAAIAHGDPEGDMSPIARTVRVLNPALRIVPVPPAFRTPEQNRAAVSRTPVATAEPAFVDIAIERGVPVGVNGVAMPWADLIGSLQIIARAHGLGPSPLGLVEAAHRALRSMALSTEAERFGAHVAAEYRRMLDDGSWFSPMRPALDAYVDTLQQTVGGAVRLKLFNGTCTVVDTHVAPTAAATIIPVAKAHR
jgi:argininosuccinate synthase